MPSQVRCERVPPHCPWEAPDVRGLDLSGALLSSLGEDQLPIDPRSWRRAEVSRWVARSGGLAERFPMNGKALCLMTSAMFVARVPTHGLSLYRDFRRRLAKALAIQELLEKINNKESF